MSLRLLSRVVALAAAGWVAVVPMSSAEETAQAPDVRSWLGKMSQAFHELNYDATFIFVHEGRIESMRVLHALVDGHERERLFHLNGPAREILRDDKNLISILPDGAEGPIHETDLQRAAFTGVLLSDVDRLARYYDFQLAGSARVADRPSQNILVTSKDGFRYGYRLWLDEKTGLLLRSDLVDERGQIIEQILVVNLTVKDALPAQELEAHSQGRQVQTHLNMVPAGELGPDKGWRVSWLPDGFSLVGREQRQSSSGPTEYLMFNDGLTTVSIYIQENSAEARQAEVMRRGGTTVYDLGGEGYRVTVVGDVPLVTAQKIAASVRRESHETVGMESNH